MIPVAIVGAHGRMGIVAAKAIDQLEGFSTVATIGRNDDLDLGIANAEIVIDVTLPDCVFANAVSYQAAGKKMIIGTSGLNHKEIETLKAISVEKKLGGIIAPNFSIAAILMMQTAAMCARFLPSASIEETHHPQKQDAPSGTAVKTANMMAKYIPDVPIHSVRIPGALAEQTVRFGNTGETLIVHHRMSDRDAFIPGIQLACQKVMQCDQLYYGLESFLLKDSA